MFAGVVGSWISGCRWGPQENISFWHTPLTKAEPGLGMRRTAPGGNAVFVFRADTLLERSYVSVQLLC